MVKPLTFKGDKKPKKRKRTDNQPPDDDGPPSSKLALVAAADAAATGDQDPDNDDSWVSAETVGDLAGPVMVVLPTEPPTALAADAGGKVFALSVENMVDGNPDTAEPHDVRQVWIVSKISGTEYYRLKASHNKYLSCDKHGILAATSDTISPLESFTLLPTPDTPGTFQLHSQRETFLTAREAKGKAKGSGSSTAAVEVRGDATEISFASTLRLRMQARFKPRVKASREEKAREKISRRELEAAAGRRLDEDEVRRLKRARREGDYHEQLLMLKTKSKHDKYG